MARITKPKQTPKFEKDPEVYLRKAVMLANCAPRADEEDIEAAIRAFGDALLRADRAKRKGVAA